MQKTARFIGLAAAVNECPYASAFAMAQHNYMFHLDTIHGKF
jgi:hypothetical protein